MTLRHVLGALGAVLLPLSSSAVLLPVQQTLELVLANFPQPRVTAQAPGAVEIAPAQANPLDEIRIADVGTLSFSGILPVTDPLAIQGGVYAIQGNEIRLRTDLQGGVFGNLQAAVGVPQSGLTPATLPLTGTLRYCVLNASCDPTLTVAVPIGSEASNGFVGAGVGGVLTIGGAAGAFRVSVLGAPWTVGTVTVFSRTDQGAIAPVTAQGFAHGPASATGSTSLSSGVLELVSASQIQSANYGIQDYTGVTHRYTLRLPEPARFVSLLLGVVWLTALGWRRRR